MSEAEPFNDPRVVAVELFTSFALKRLDAAGSLMRGIVAVATDTAPDGRDAHASELERLTKMAHRVDSPDLYDRLRALNFPRQRWDPSNVDDGVLIEWQLLAMLDLFTTSVCRWGEYLFPNPYEAALSGSEVVLMRWEEALSGGVGIGRWRRRLPFDDPRNVPTVHPADAAKLMMEENRELLTFNVNGLVRAVGSMKETVIECVAALPTSRRRPRPENPAPIHSDDFTHVNWFGTEYRFAFGHQANVVRLLWEEWAKGRLGLSQQTIAKAIESGNDHYKIQHTFRGHPALGSMIMRVGKGIYALVEPQD